MSTREELQAIYDANGELTPDLVLAVASAPEHPLHERFEWDDGEAAHKYRLTQAGWLIRSVKVTVQHSPKSEPVRVRAFVADRELRDGDREDRPDEAVGQYLPVERVVEDDVLRTAWFRQLERDWKTLKARAGASREFADMVLRDITAA